LQAKQDEAAMGTKKLGGKVSLGQQLRHVSHSPASIAAWIYGPNTIYRETGPRGMSLRDVRPVELA
jgi:hypothetical protein